MPSFSTVLPFSLPPPPSSPFSLCRGGCRSPFSLWGGWASLLRLVTLECPYKHKDAVLTLSFFTSSLIHIFAIGLHHRWLLLVCYAQLLRPEKLAQRVDSLSSMKGRWMPLVYEKAGRGPDRKMRRQEKRELWRRRTGLPIHGSPEPDRDLVYVCRVPFLLLL